MQRIVAVDEELCTGCGRCVSVCAQAAIQVVDGTARVDWALCNGCGVCVVECPERAVHAAEVLSAEREAVTSTAVSAAGRYPLTDRAEQRVATTGQGARLPANVERKAVAGVGAGALVGAAVWLGKRALPRLLDLLESGSAVSPTGSDKRGGSASGPGGRGAGGRRRRRRDGSGR